MSLPTTIALRACNGQYVSAMNGGGQNLLAAGPAMGPWETFTLTELGSGLVALQSWNGQYVSAINGGWQNLLAAGPAVGAWESLALIDLGNGQVAFRSCGGQYICAEDNGGQSLIANRTAIGPWETFTLIDRRRASIISMPARNGAYDFATALLLPQPGRGAVCFTANGTNDIHVGISTSTRTTDPMYEIVIGGWGNGQSVIRRSSQGTAFASTPTGLTAPGTNNQLWVAIDSGSGLIQVGRGAVGQNVFLSYKDPNFVSNAQYVAFSSWNAPITYTNVSCVPLPAKTLAFFDSPGSAVSLGNPAKLNITGKISISAWINPQASDGLRNIVTRGYCLNPAGEILLRICNGNYQLGSWDANGEHLVSVPMPAGDLGSWVHLTGVYDGQSWLLYRNGLLLTQSANPVGAVPVAAGWSIGSRGDAIERCFKGYISTVTIWNIALDANSVQRLMIDGPVGQEPGLCGYWPIDEASGSTVRDLSANPQNGTQSNGKWVLASRPALPSSTLNFSGNVSSYVSLGNPDKLKITGPITMTAWVRVAATDGIRNILAHGFTYTTPAEVYFRIINGSYQCGSWNGSDSFTGAVIPSADVGRWVHLAGVFDGQRWILYRNGQILAQSNQSVGAISVPAPWAIGAKGDGAERLFKGSIYGVSMWRTALDQAGVQRCMMGALSGGEAGLCGYWPLNENGGAVASDYSPAPQNGQANNIVWSAPTSIGFDQRDYTNWMSSLPDIDNKRLCDICLPRSHDSATSMLTTTLAPVLYEFDFLRYLYPTVDVDYLLNSVDSSIPSFVHAIVKTGIPVVQSLVNTIVIDAVQGWSRATGMTIAQQLNAGVRMFDLRVCSSNGQIRSFHGFTGALLSDVLADVAAFMARAQREVVILQFSHMASLSSSDHTTFTNLIENVLGGYLYPVSSGTDLTTVSIGTLTTNNGARTSRVIAIYDDNDGNVTTGYNAYKSSRTVAKIWPYGTIDIQKVDGATQGAITSMDQIGTCQNAWLAGYSRQSKQLGALDFARTPDLKDLLPSILMSIFDALQLSAIAGSKQNLCTQAIAANRRILGFLQQTSVTNRAKINAISLDFAEYSYVTYLAIALSKRDQAAIDAPSFLPQLPDSDFAIHQKYSRSFGHLGTPHVDVHADTQVTGHIDSAVIPHADSSGAHSDADMYFFHLDSTPHFDTPSAGHIDTAPIHADSPHADVSHQDVNLHIDVN